MTRTALVRPSCEIWNTATSTICGNSVVPIRSVHESWMPEERTDRKDRHREHPRLGSGQQVNGLAPSRNSRTIY